MSYECNDGSCRPCKHIELDVVCPNCNAKRLIQAPTSNWVYCPDWHNCGFEHSHEAHLKYDYEGERKKSYEALLVRLEDELEVLTAKVDLVKRRIESIKPSISK